MIFRKYIKTKFQEWMDKNSYILTISLTFYQKDFDISDNTDTTRLRSLELMSQEIKSNQIPGAVAELGVYRGDFAKYINEAFPDRKIPI